MSKSVSGALKVLFRYIFFCVAGTVCCSILFWIYGLCQVFVAGESLPSFSLSILIFGLRKYAPVVLECTSIFLGIFLVNRWNCKVLPVIVYVVLGLGTWFGLCPLMERYVVPANDSLEQKMEQVHVSSNFFRRVGDDVLFYSLVDGESLADGVVIDLEEGTVLTFEKMNVRAAGSAGSASRSGKASGVRLGSIMAGAPVSGSAGGSGKFKDSLVEEQVLMPFVVERLLVGVEAFCVVQRKVAQQGWIQWLWFASMGVALISCAGLMNASRWKLLNDALVVIFSVFVLVMNTFFYLPNSVFSGGVQWVNNLLSFASFIPNQTAFLFNLVLTLAMTVLGIIFDVRAVKEAKEEGIA